MLNREAILGADDLTRERVDVPEWGGEVYVAMLTGRDRDAFEAGCQNDDGSKNWVNVRARLAVRCIVDEQGQRIFSDADAEALGRKSAAALARVFDVAARLNHLTEKDLEDLEKNSRGGPSAASISG